MNKDANEMSQIGMTRCTKAERDGALDFAVFLYDQWQKSQNGEIIKVGKIYKNEEEPNNGAN